MFSFGSRWRTIAAATVFSCLGMVQAAPALTTVQDILYRADGTRFNGTITISWTNFYSGDQSTIPVQAITVEVVNGNFKVQLVPTTTASAGASYTVRYASQGRFQFTENWAVPPSSTALKIKDVRVGTGSVVGPPPVVTQVEITGVTGLSNELNLRPVRGTAYAASRAAVINAAGQLDAATGDTRDCVRVDGTSTPCGGTTTTTTGTLYAFADAETPTGTVNGANPSFTVVNTPQPAASLALYRNGVLMKPGVDFTLSGNTVTFAAASIPQTGDLLTANYRYGTSSPTTAANFVDAETPIGNVDGSNTSYVLAQAPSPAASLQLYRNGILMKQGSDYSVNDKVVTFVTASVPQTGDLLQASYRYPLAATAGALYDPLVLCSNTSGICAIPAESLRNGDRISIRFEYVHEGSTSGFTTTARWGASAMLARNASADETLVSGLINATVRVGSADWITQSWGTVTPLENTSGTALDPLTEGITITVNGTSTGDNVTLRTFTVTRYPAP